MFEKFIKWLESLGFEVLEMGGRCPWQLCLNHPDGYLIYCRSRHTRFDFYVYSELMTDDHHLPDDEFLIFESGFENWEDPDAGYVEVWEAWQCFHSCWSDMKEAIA